MPVFWRDWAYGLEARATEQKPDQRAGTRCNSDRGYHLYLRSSGAEQLGSNQSVEGANPSGDTIVFLQ